MKITVNYTMDEITSTVNTIADVTNELAASVESGHRISSEERNRVLTKIKNETFANESHSPAVDVTMTASELVIDIKDEAYLDTLKMVVKAVNVFSPFIGGMINILKGICRSAELMKDQFATFRKKWTVSEEDTYYHVIYVEHEGVKYKVVLSYDGYEKRLYGVFANSIDDASDKYVDYLLTRYREALKDISDDAFHFTKSEVDELTHQW